MTVFFSLSSFVIMCGKIAFKSLHRRSLFLYFFFLPQDRIQIEQGTLNITIVNLSDAGMYQCVAENKHGVIFSSAELSVIGECL